jgi:hypothetical protein
VGGDDLTGGVGKKMIRWVAKKDRQKQAAVMATTEVNCIARSVFVRAFRNPLEKVLDQILDIFTLIICVGIDSADVVRGIFRFLINGPVQVKDLPGWFHAWSLMERCFPSRMTKVHD